MKSTISGTPISQTSTYFPMGVVLEQFGAGLRMVDGMRRRRTAALCVGAPKVRAI